MCSQSKVVTLCIGNLLQMKDTGLFDFVDPRRWAKNEYISPPVEAYSSRHTPMPPALCPLPSWSSCHLLQTMEVKIAFQYSHYYTGIREMVEAFQGLQTMQKKEKPLSEITYINLHSWPSQGHEISFHMPLCSHVNIYFLLLLQFLFVFLLKIPKNSIFLSVQLVHFPYAVLQS